MQDVNFSSNRTINDESAIDMKSMQYTAPMAMKQHASRLKKYTLTGNDEFDKTSKTSSTYHSNYVGFDDRSDIEAKLMSEGEVEFDELVAHQKHLLELQDNVQRSLNLIQQRLKQNSEKQKPISMNEKNCIKISNKFDDSQSYIDFDQTIVNPENSEANLLTENDFSFDLAKNFGVNNQSDTKTPEKV